MTRKSNKEGYARTVREVLIAARWILANVGWTQGEWARTSQGCRCSVSDETATCFCAFGAVCAVMVSDETVRHEACGVLRGTHMVTFNDSPDTTRAMVLAKFDEMIASLP